MALPSLTVIFRSSPSLTCPIVRPRVSESESRRGRGRGGGREKGVLGWGLGTDHVAQNADTTDRPRPTERVSTLHPQPYIPTSGYQHPEPYTNTLNAALHAPPYTLLTPPNIYTHHPT